MKPATFSLRSFMSRLVLSALVSPACSEIASQNIYWEPPRWLLSPDGDLVIGRDGPAVNVWSIATGEHLFSLRDHSEDVNCMAISADGKYIITGSGALSPPLTQNPDNDIRLWSLETRELIRRFGRHKGGVRHVAFSPDGETFLVDAGDAARFRLWRVRDGQEEFIFRSSAAMFSGPAEVIDVRNNAVLRWDTDAFMPLSTCRFPGLAVTNVHVRVQDGSALIVTSDNAVYWWRGSDDPKKVLPKQEARVTGVALIPDSSECLVAFADSTVHKMALVDDGEVLRFEAPGVVRKVEFSPDGLYAILKWSDAEKPHNAYIEGMSAIQVRGPLSMLPLYPGESFQEVIGRPEFIRLGGSAHIAVVRKSDGNHVVSLSCATCEVVKSIALE